MAKLIMSWSKCKITIAESAGDTFPASLTSIGLIKENTTTLESSDGTELKATATGGVVVGHERKEGGLTLTTRVIEPTDALLTLLGIGTAADSSFNVKTHIANKTFALQVEPKNVGAKGIRAVQTDVYYKPGFGEEEGNYADLVFNILPVLDENFEVSQWYSRYTKGAETAGA